MAGPLYAAHVDAYRAAGWPSVLPMPPGAKTPPPKGYTGEGGIVPDDATYVTWKVENARGNIALRLPADIVGIDVDAYKPEGATSWALLNANLSPLPPTVRSTSRADGVSGIRLFRVPPGARFKSNPLPGIEMIQHHHRYVMVGPSVHPDTGTVYVWLDDTGDLRVVPIIGHRPGLPADWSDALAEGGTPPSWWPTSPKPAPRTTGNGHRPIVLGHHVHPWCAEVVTNAIDDMARGMSRHDTAVRATAKLVPQVHAGNPGAADALDEMHAAFVTAVADRSTEPQAEKEWADMVASADSKFSSTLAPHDPQHGGARTRERIDEPKVVMPDTAATLLPATFYDARPRLAHIRDAAYSRGRGADAVFACTLARVDARERPTTRLPAIVGSVASLNLFVVLVADSGVGKTTSNAVGGELVPFHRNADGTYEVHEAPIGSGEGLAELYMGPDSQAPPGKPAPRVMIRDRVYSYNDEGKAILDIGGRNGTITFATLRSAWSGALLGQSNAEAARTRRLPAHSYRLALSMGLHPSTAGALFADVEEGLAQRFLAFNASDPHIPDRAPPWPGPLDIARIGGLAEHLIVVDPDVAAEVRAHDLAVNRGTIVLPLNESHGYLQRLKIAALLGIIDGRHAVTVADWQLSGTVWDTSQAVKARSVALAVVATRERHQAGDRLAVQRELAIVGSREQRALDTMVRAIGRHVHKGHDDPCNRACLTRATPGASRALVAVDDAIAACVARGYIERVGAQFKPGDSRPT